MVCGDFNAHNTEWLGHSHTTDVAGVFCQEFALAQDLTQIVDFPTRIPDRVDHQPYLLDLFICSNPDSCTVASHPPLGRSDHIVVCVDVKFVVKSTNEHPYHRTVYSYSKADWDGLRDHLRMCLGLISLTMISPLLLRRYLSGLRLVLTATFLTESSS
jgi:hypothetical protein